MDRGSAAFAALPRLVLRCRVLAGFVPAIHLFKGRRDVLAASGAASFPKLRFLSNILAC
jgi:hypothetical protein